jgi:hypothetical protein
VTNYEYADTLGHDWEAEDRIGCYSDWNIARLRKAADLVYAMAVKISYAGTCSMLGEWSVALRQCDEAKELGVAAFRELDCWQEAYAERLSNLDEDVCGPLSNIAFCAGRNEALPDDERHHGSDREEWDRFLHRIARDLEALADNLSTEAER